MGIMLWKGVWDGVDHWTGSGVVQGISTLSLGLLCLSCSGTVKTAWSMPNGIVVDREEDHISSDTYLRSGPGDTGPRRVNDCLISRLLEVATIFVWHGVWSLTDIYSEQTLCQLDTSLCLDSALFSLMLGWSGGCLIFVSQVPLIFFSQFRHSNKLNLILFNIINFIFNVAGVYFTINSFRAAWYLLDLYFFTSFKIISWVGGQILGLIILILLRCTSCLHAGIYRDEADCGILVSYHLTSLALINRFNSTKLS